MDTDFFHDANVPCEDVLTANKRQKGKVEQKTVKISQDAEKESHSRNSQRSRILQSDTKSLPS